MGIVPAYLRGCSPAGRTVVVRLRGAGTIGAARRDQQQRRRHLQTNQLCGGPAEKDALRLKETIWNESAERV